MLCRFAVIVENTLNFTEFYATLETAIIHCKSLSKPKICYNKKNGLLAYAQCMTGHAFYGVISLHTLYNIVLQLVVFLCL